MKEIIKEGVIPKFETECINCKCLFTYERRDIETDITPYGAVVFVVKCPTCGCGLTTEETRRIKAYYGEED